MAAPFDPLTATVRGAAVPVVSAGEAEWTYWVSGLSATGTAVYRPTGFTTVLLATGAPNDFPTSPGPDPDSLLVVRVQPETSGDVYHLSLRGSFEPKPLVVTPARASAPRTTT